MTPRRTEGRALRGGRQFIAAPAALGGVFRSLTAKPSPEIYQPEGGTLFVFALPE